DSESGLCYNRFRYYDPAGGGYISPDPIGVLGGDNLYAYAPNPLTWIDPLGLAKCGTGEYKDVGGHHIHAKAGFKSNPKYDPKKGFSISQDYMDKMGLDHQAMTSYQRQAFKELYNSGRPNTLAEHTKIAVNALESGGATTQQARSLVAESLWNLRSQGAISPSNIPWYK
ncbi:RHS repeat-associated core domain-containing protein, partial [Lonsdalea quercina]